MSEVQQFRSVLRGYDPAQVEATLRELGTAAEQARAETTRVTSALAAAEAARGELTDAVRERDEQLVALHERLDDAERRAATPTFSDLGERIGEILNLAGEEAESIRSSAAEDADGVRLGAETDASTMRAEADRYAEDVRTKAEIEAARVLEEARSRADQILDEADGQASARREEAEALFEKQRARAAAAAADFETTLAARRDRAAEDFRTQMSQQENSLAAMQERADSLFSDASRTLEEAKAEATTLLESARAESRSLVTSAREQAERVKRDSDRELAALAARRDSITAQLTNVRQMLATLGGGTFAVGAIDDLDTDGSADVVEAEAAAMGVEGAPDVVAEDGDPVLDGEELVVLADDSSSH